MPNIEIVGFSHSDKEVYGIVDAIKASLSGTEYEDEVVITEMYSYCADLKGNQKPFLRVCDTDNTRLHEIGKRLSTILDVEMVLLSGFLERV
jgi:hypothetical protein